MQQLYAIHTPAYLADTYGSGAYENNVYSATGSNTTSGGTGSTSGGGSEGALANTGVFVLGFITIAALILLTALVIRHWRKPAKQTK